MKISVTGLMVVVLASISSGALADMAMTEAEEMAIAEKIVGPTNNDDNCESCHTLESEAWQFTHHFATFQTRHRSEEAREILTAMEERSMKRAPQCRQCHYTNEVATNGRLRATFGVSCESCHGPARDWLAIHSKVGGDINSSDLKWGTGRNEDTASREARLGMAQEMGMIHSRMTYDIAKNCFGCHTVPNEEIVNKGGHKSGSDFELVAWSQGEVRHNFVSSAGAPDSPTNDLSPIEQLRRLYVTGLMVDLETTIRNLAAVQESGGKFHTAMVERANLVRGKLDTLLATVAIPEIKDALAAVPDNFDASTSVESATADVLGTAAQAFLAAEDGSGISAVDALLPTSYQGDAYGG